MAIVFLRDLFSVVMVAGAYSLLSAMFFVNLDAVDVAFTEAAVGAGISTVLMLATLALTKDRVEKRNVKHGVIPKLVVLVTTAALIYGTYDIPAFGDPNSPAQEHVKPYYIERGIEETGVPNIVTAVLASYRGYDTLGEVIVIFTAGIGVVLLIGNRLLTRKEDENEA